MISSTRDTALRYPFTEGPAFMHAAAHAGLRNADEGIVDIDNTHRCQGKAACGGLCTVWK